MEYSVFDSISLAFQLLFKFWWVYLPFFLVFESFWLYQRFTRTRYQLGLKWVLLEITPPPDVVKSPKGVENLYAGLHAIYKGPLHWKNRFFKGELQDWFSLEIVGNEGSMHLYVRSPEAHRNLVEAEIFAQWPDAEVTLVEDYIKLLPDKLPNDEYDLFGADLIFTKENPYPIKTYDSFEEKPAAGKNDFKRTDVLAPMAEVIGFLKPGEYIWVQLLIRATGGDWAKEAKPLLEKLQGKTPKPAPASAIYNFMTSIESLLGVAPAPAEKKEEKAPNPTGGERGVMDAIENKTSKLAFKSNYRFLYIGRKDVFNRSRVSAVTGVFKQLYANNLNSFKPDPKTATSSKGFLYQIFPSNKGFFAAPQEYKRKVKIYKAYRGRTFTKKPFIFNTEELATVFRMPDIFVQAPALPRVPAKRGQPPGLLPT